MSRGSFRSLSVFFWLVAPAIAAMTFGLVSSRIEATHPGGGQGLTFVGIFAFFLVGLLIQARIEDAICPVEVPSGPEDEAGRRAELETRAAQALREHRPSEALALLESAELWAKALELAHSLKDEEACGRCNFHLGRYDAARQQFLKAGNLEAAARVCYMMRHVSEARTLFQQAAGQMDEGKAPGHCAALWDRGGETIRAARLYESIGDYKRLAECAEVLGQYARAQSARERHQLKLTDERRRSATARSEKELRAEATRLGTAPCGGTLTNFPSRNPCRIHVLS